MKRRKCANCNNTILGSGVIGSYLCRDCQEMIISDESRYSYLYNV